LPEVQTEPPTTALAGSLLPSSYPFDPFAASYRKAGDGKSPELLGPEEIRQYQVYLVNERRVSWSYLIQTVCALRFLYCVTLKLDWPISRIPYPRQPRRLPVVLSQAEVRRFFDAIRSPKYLAMLMTAYAADLRLSEVTQLCVSDIDSSRM
jgi:integrase/recombinase XerD